jgi:hypothetical protein
MKEMLGDVLAVILMLGLAFGAVAFALNFRAIAIWWLS